MALVAEYCSIIRDLIFLAKWQVMEATAEGIPFV
jgi:hypothetical protein